MGAITSYYKKVLHHKYLYFKHGKKFGVSLCERLTHNLEMLKPSFASQLARILYYPDGSPRPMSEQYKEIMSEYRKRHPYYVDYWLDQDLKVVPEKYLRSFLAERYVDCDSNWNRLLMSNRDLLFLHDITEEPTYSSQVNDIVRRVRLGAI